MSHFDMPRRPLANMTDYALFIVLVVCVLMLWGRW